MTTSGSQRGFTLLELLLVMLILALVAAFTIPALTGLTRAGDLNSASRLVTNLLTVARSEAINRRVLIRFEIATAWPPDTNAAYRKITLVQHDATAGTDTQLTAWETLPSGVTFQPQDPSPGNGSYFFSLSQTQTPSLKVGTQNVATSYIEFLPTGALNVTPSNSPVRLRLVPGFLASAGTVKLTSATNWFETSVDGIVGRIKTSRP
jgi:prepilin-type N-terminal cleavage/methylation domain-containing protein